MGSGDGDNGGMLVDNSGSGGGGSYDPSAHRPECDRSNGKNATYLTFIDAHLADAKKLAQQLGVTIQDILGVAGEESAFGDPIKSNLAAHNNFFGLHNRIDGTFFPGQIDTYWTRPKTGNPVPTPVFTVASGFYDSGEVFVNRERPFLNVLGGYEPGTFASIIHQHGYGVGQSDYVDKTVKVINDFALRLDCPH